MQRNVRIEDESTIKVYRKKNIENAKKRKVHFSTNGFLHSKRISVASYFRITLKIVFSHSFLRRMCNNSLFKEKKNVNPFLNTSKIWNVQYHILLLFRKGFIDKIVDIYRWQNWMNPSLTEYSTSMWKSFKCFYFHVCQEIIFLQQILHFDSSCL